MLSFFKRKAARWNKDGKKGGGATAGEAVEGRAEKLSVMEAQGEGKPRKRDEYEPKDGGTARAQPEPAEVTSPVDRDRGEERESRGGTNGWIYEDEEVMGTRKEKAQSRVVLFSDTVTVARRRSCPECFQKGTNKEVVNLLLPRERLRARKEAALLGGVQSLLGRFGRKGAEDRRGGDRERSCSLHEGQGGRVLVRSASEPSTGLGENIFALQAEVKGDEVRKVEESLEIGGDVRREHGSGGSEAKLYEIDDCIPRDERGTGAGEGAAEQLGDGAAPAAAAGRSAASQQDDSAVRLLCLQEVAEPSDLRPSSEELIAEQQVGRGAAAARGEGRATAARHSASAGSDAAGADDAELARQCAAADSPGPLGGTPPPGDMGAADSREGGFAVQSIEPQLEAVSLPGAAPAMSDERAPKRILRDAARGDGARKRVTFHSVIDFDDGDRICDSEPLEDDSAMDSFASFDDDEDSEDGGPGELDGCELPDLVHDGLRCRKERDIREESFSVKCIESSDDECDDDVKAKCPYRDAEEGKELAGLEDDGDECSAACVIEVENNENLGPDDVEESECDVIITEVSESSGSEELKRKHDAFHRVEIVEELSSESTAAEGSSGTADSDGDSLEEDNEDELHHDSEPEEKSTEFRQVPPEKCDCERGWQENEDDDDSACADLLRAVGKQLRGLADQDGKLADLQERAAALHRVQAEVRGAHKEAELVRQKLRDVEADLSATRTRNCCLLGQLEAQAGAALAAEEAAARLGAEGSRLQKRLDELLPECEQLREQAARLRHEREEDRRDFDKELAKEREARAADAQAQRREFEKLRSQGAESEELLLADCEWKLRDVQRQARERVDRAEARLSELQQATDERCAAADRQLLQAVREELAQSRAHAAEQQRQARGARAQAAAAQAAQAAAAQEAARLRALLDQELAAVARLRAQHATDSEAREQRTAARLAEQAARLEAENAARLEQRVLACRDHEAALADARDKLAALQDTLVKKEAHFSELLERTKSRSDWELLELRRHLDKADLKHQEAMERLEEEHAAEIEALTEEGSARARQLESALAAQASSARATLELVRGELHAEHADALQLLKDAHRKEMEDQWEMFTDDKERCLERMKAECALEGQEERQKRDKMLLRDLEELKSELSTRDNTVGSLRSEVRKACDARADVERRLSEVATTMAAREQAVRSEAARAAEVAQREARETIDHLTKKCACLTNLFEDMRARWQQAPGEAAQLRRALQDERARGQALRRQLEALSRPFEPQKWQL